MQENYPLWFTFWHLLGVRVQLSPRSSGRVHGWAGTNPPECACWPAKVAHGHVEALPRNEIKLVFSPCALMEQKEHAGTNQA
jgi:predicted nucleotide-binding protein (sugar kinase/HSP70/actin superfamily)